MQNTAAFRQAFQWNNSVTIFSTQAGMEAFESGGEPSTGYFAETLAQALRGDFREAVDKDGAVTVGKLIDFLPDAVSRRVSEELPGRSQQPQIIANITGRIVLTMPGLMQGPSDGRPTHVVATSSPPDVRLRLRVPDGALTTAGLVVANNKMLLATSALAAPLAVRPGKHFVEVKLPGYKEWSREVDISAGELSVDVRLEPRRWPFVASLVGAAVGFGAMATGLAFLSHANKIEAEVSRACGSAGTSCDWENTYRSKNEAGQLANTRGNAFLITGGIVAAGGSALAAYFYLSRPVLASDTGFSIVPGPNYAGLNFGRTW